MKRILISQMNSGTTEMWASIAAAAAAVGVIARKLLSASKRPKPEYISRSEFHHELEATRNRIGAGYLALNEKIDAVQLTLADKMEANHAELLSAIAHQGETFERRIDQLETNMARVDERTKAL